MIPRKNAVSSTTVSESSQPLDLEAAMKAAITSPVEDRFVSAEHVKAERGMLPENLEEAMRLALAEDRESQKSDEEKAWDDLVSTIGDLLEMLIHDDVADIYIRYRTYTEADHVIPSGFGKVVGVEDNEGCPELVIEWGPKEL